MKHCSACNTDKKDGEFYPRRAKCKACVIAQNRDNYYRQHDKYLQYHRDHNKTAQESGRKAELRAWIKLKKSGPCLDCSGTFPPECMDFDHREPGDKTANIAAMVGAGRSREAIEAEISKCDLICANCHRIRTAKILDWY